MMSNDYYTKIKERNKQLGIQCPKCGSHSIQMPGSGSLFCYDCGHFFEHEKDPRKTGV